MRTAWVAPESVCNCQVGEGSRASSPDTGHKALMPGVTPRLTGHNARNAPGMGSRSTCESLSRAYRVRIATCLLGGVQIHRRSDPGIVESSRLGSQNSAHNVTTVAVCRVNQWFRQLADHPTQNRALLPTASQQCTQGRRTKLDCILAWARCRGLHC